MSIDSIDMIMKYLMDYYTMHTEVYIKMIADKIKALREAKGFTQSDLQNNWV